MGSSDFCQDNLKTKVKCFRTIVAVIGQKVKHRILEDWEDMGVSDVSSKALSRKITEAKKGYSFVFKAHRLTLMDHAF